MVDMVQLAFCKLTWCKMTTVVENCMEMEFLKRKCGYNKDLFQVLK